MPELPEVETMRRGLAATVASRIVAVERVAGPCKPIEIRPRIGLFHRRAVGTSICRLARAGKRVVIWLDSDEAIVLEPRMSGLVLTVDPPTQEHLRVRIKLAGGPIGEILYWDRRGLGKVGLVSGRTFQAEYGPGALGPDALTITAAQLSERLGSSRRAIKVALLDQRMVAGIGNLYAPEILHVARIDPQRPCNWLRGRVWQALAEAMHRVLQEAIDYEGSTLGDGTYRNALNQAGGYQKLHRVYGKAGHRCPSCRRGIVKRFVQAQRSTFYCPVCQRPGSPPDALLS